MDNNQRPHSRKKTVGTGSAQVHVGHQVNTGSGSVGGASHSGGAHSGGGNGRRASSGGGLLGSLLGGKLSLKTILIIVAVLVIGSIVLKGFGGQGNDIDIDDGGDDYSDVSTTAPQQNSGASSYADADTKVSNLARAKYVTPVGGGNDTVTIMVYMCGTDLESKYGMATKDLQEMARATLSDKVNIIVETGGCKSWQTKGISNSNNQIYQVKNGGLTVLEKNAGQSAMTDPANLTSFIKYCAENYPADRSMLIFWDHGGGTLSGYGYDEKYPSSSSMTLGKIDTALKNAGVKFDWIGFDACLMATLETDIVCAQYADYLIGSEETEPGTGWYYTNWLTKLSKNTSMSTVEISKNIIDDFVSSSKSASRNAKVTLSVVDLAELQGTVPVAFRDFASSTNEKLQSGEYKNDFAGDCTGTRQFAEANKINQVDMIDLCKRIGTSEAKDLASALQGCVKYNKTTISNANGISVFFPVSGSTGVKNAVSSYKEIGIDSEYSECVKSFASLLMGGQIAGSATQIPDFGSLLGGGDFGSIIGNILGGSGSTGSSGGLDLGSVIGSVLGGGSSSSSSLGSNIAGSLIGSLLGGTQSSTASTSPIPALLGTFLGGSSTQSSSSSAGFSLDPSMLTNLLGAFSGKSLPQQYDWVDTELIADQAESIANDFVDPSRITATEKNGKNVLELTDDEWKLIKTIELNVFAKDGDGYVDLGYDNVFEWTDDNDLLLEYDGTWLTLNGNACAYYLVTDTEQDNGEWITEGRIPAILNGQLVNLRVVFTEEAPEGIVTGAYPLYEDETDVQAKGDVEIAQGDEIELLCDYYSLDGETSSTYTLGTSFTVPAEGLTLENLTMEADGLTATYKLTDIYGNNFWLPIE